MGEKKGYYNNQVRLRKPYTIWSSDSDTPISWNDLSVPRKAVGEGYMGTVSFWLQEVARRIKQAELDRKK